MNSSALAVLDLVRARVAGRRRLWSRLALAGAVLSLWLVPSAAAEGPDTRLFRVILKDGTALTSYGEYARVGDRVVFSMPFGPVAERPQLQLISLPASAVDWESTGRYTEAVRYARYVETRAEEDYSSLTGEIARLLNELSATPDAARRLEIAEGARHLLADWPRTHFGYRSKDIREMMALLDEAISELRATAGAQQFDLKLVAIVEPPTMPLLPDPTPAQLIDQALAAARVADNSVERMSLFRSVIAFIDQSLPVLSRDWAKRARESALAALKVETRTDQAYAKLRHRIVASADRRGADADVRGVDRLLQQIKQTDAALGTKRPDDVAALIAHVETKLDAARLLRLARDRWALRSGALLAYRDLTARIIQEFEAIKPALAEIRSLSGPDPRRLRRLRQRIIVMSERLATIGPPPELASLHAMLVSACHLAVQAVDGRERAIVSQDIRVAWDASAAASGATMLVIRAWTDMQALFKPPELR